MDIDKILSQLNEQQLEAVRSTEGYVRVVAGAGSGKTRALTARYAYLVEELGISPANILCITFTNKAAREMKNRLRYMLGNDIDISFVSTLHSFCVRVLKEDIGKLFYPESFVILDNTDQKNILEEVYEELGIKMDTATFEYMIDKIRLYKNKTVYGDYMQNPREGVKRYDAADEAQKEVIARYMEKQKKYFGLDFFDIINFVVHLFKFHDDVAIKWSDRLHYVMMDEFQDTNSKEVRILRLLTDVHQNFFVVGDGDQNIYEWRGCPMLNFTMFIDYMKSYYTDEDLLPQYFPFHTVPPLKAEFKTIFLNENYRSTPEILAASNSLISKNQNRDKKELHTQNESGPKPEHFHAKNDNEETAYIAGKINEHISAGGKYSDIAIIYRANYISRFVENCLRKNNIPYTVYGGISFYERKEIKDVLSYLRLVANGDDLSFMRVINTPRRNIGKKKIEFLKARAEADKSTLYEAFKKHIDDNIFSGSDAKEFLKVMESAIDRANEMQVSELLQKILHDTKYEAYLRETGDMDRLDNVTELLRSIVTMETEYGEPLTLETFMRDVALGMDVQNAADEKNDSVKIMTAHISKGLEFHTVIITGLSEGTFPSARALEERREEALEEERRLFYVAMTRAKKCLFMTECEGIGFRNLIKTPSRFLFDIDDEFIIRFGEIGEEIMWEFKCQTFMRKPSNENLYPLGAKVRHKIFGEGIIEEINMNTKSYMIRFMVGIKPVRFDYKKLSQVF